ncbi:hypothetical protein C6501_05170 [Candidatus Poribacteria bacterium]|nr:MAG: hypothetical protein C6501_05170 [Candidatus Poribacteria bacterium]
MSVEERGTYLEQRGLPADATWEMYEETLLKNNVVDSINFWRSKQQDPYINGTLPNEGLGLLNILCKSCITNISEYFKRKQKNSREDIF